MHDYDVVIIGAGMSGLGAGIRLAQYERRVCIVERHTVYGGLNSFYTLAGRRFDVGLHALTNFVPPGVRGAPLPKLLRQLRIPREALDLREQHYSAVCFPGRRLRFSNDPQLLIDEVADLFPAEIDGFRRHIEAVKSHDDLDPHAPWRSARRAIAEFIKDPILIDMLLCPLMYYGSAEEHDMDWSPYVTLFKSIYLEGLSRPREGVRRIIAELVKRYRSCGGSLRMGCGVRRLALDGRRVHALHLDSGEVLTAGRVLSSIGLHETMRLCSDPPAPLAGEDLGRLSFMESIFVMPDRPADLGFDTTIVFFNDAETFTYACPPGLIDPRSGVICCPNNYCGHDDMPEGVIRLTTLANYDRWAELDEPGYATAKAVCREQALDRAVRFMPEFRQRVAYCDTFTPRTIQRFTGHLRGAVYGAPCKARDGRTHLENLFLCGTDQGFLGIIGALLSGIMMANRHVLAAD